MTPLLTRLAVVSLLAVPLSAASIVFADPFGGGGGDVIGDPRSFDIQFASVTITQTAVTVEIGLNFGLAGQSNLDPFRYSWSPWLSVGDVLFFENGVPKWGVPVADHGGSLNGGPGSNLLFAGQMYEVLNSNGWFTARQALNDPPDDYYRYESAVWLRDAGGSLAAEGFAGFVNVTYLGGDGSDAPRFHVMLSVPTPPDLFTAWQSNLLSFSFASATCGNDLVGGTWDPSTNLTANPEPSTWVLAIMGLVALAWIRQRRASA